MVVLGRPNESDSEGALPREAPPAGRARRRRVWLPLAALALLAAGAAAVPWWLGPLGRPEAGPLDGELIVFVRPPGGGKKTRPVEEPGALPAQAGGQMSLEVHFNQPAFAYLVWLDAGAQPLPLYPWNYDRLEVKDVGQAPPTRRPTTVVFSPPLGTGWKFGKRGGMETVLLLARRTPLGEGTRLGSLLGGLPPGRVRHRGELAVLGPGGGEAVSTLLALHRGPEEEARAGEAPLRALLIRLRDHFELIRAVRFAHPGE